MLLSCDGRHCLIIAQLGGLLLAGGGGGSGGAIEGGDVRQTPPTPIPLCVEVFPSLHFLRFGQLVINFVQE